MLKKGAMGGRLTGGFCAVRSGDLLTGCVPVKGVDMCFPGDFSQGPAPCAKLQGGYNLTSLAALLASNSGADAREGSLCDPKVCAASLRHVLWPVVPILYKEGIL
jgi:hypothetical protein